jgi:hypothetical protein
MRATGAIAANRLIFDASTGSDEKAMNACAAAPPRVSAPGRDGGRGGRASARELPFTWPLPCDMPTQAVFFLPVRASTASTMHGTSYEASSSMDQSQNSSCEGCRCVCSSTTPRLLPSHTSNLGEIRLRQ